MSSIPGFICDCCGHTFTPTTSPETFQSYEGPATVTILAPILYSDKDTTTFKDCCPGCRTAIRDAIAKIKEERKKDNGKSN